MAKKALRVPEPELDGSQQRTSHFPNPSSSLRWSQSWRAFFLLAIMPTDSLLMYNGMRMTALDGNQDEPMFESKLEKRTILFRAAFERELITNQS
jgi:hypothetical protein